ncbi:MAG: HAD-IIA family hydrolase [Actinomycetes bacterium]
MPERRPLVSEFDSLLLDLDGVIYIGQQPVAHAAQAIEQCRSQFGVAVAFVTNNASRTPDSVSDQIQEIGLAARPADVVTSAQAVASHLARELPAGAKVLVVGGPGLVVALTECGLVPVTLVSERPVAVAQGFDPSVDWRMLAQAAGALHLGLPWVASNLDMTLPTELGRAPGNGSLVAALTTATGRVPISMGKPEAELVLEGIRRTGAARPLVVGDRLDTDIAAAHAAKVPSLLVLTGISTPLDLCNAPADQRPDFIGADLRALLVAHPAVDMTDGSTDATVAHCGGWSVEIRAGTVSVLFSGEAPIDGVRALARLCWWAADRDAASLLGVAELCEQLWPVGQR